MGKNPAILLYDGDWVKDGVAGCSMGAQGLWLRMCFIGHNSERYGYLQVNGLPIPPDAIARRCGCTLGEYETLLAELDRNGVPSRTPNGIIFSRRLVKDARERALATARKQNERKGNKSRSSHAPVTPLSVSEDEDVNDSVSEVVVAVGSEPLRGVVPVSFDLEPFDGQEWFDQLMKFWPHKDRGYPAQSAFVDELERVWKLKKWPQKKVAEWLIEQLRPIAEVIRKEYPQAKWKLYPITKVLKQYENGPESFRNFELQQGAPNVGKQTAGDRYSAALRGANAPHGEQLEKP